VQARGRGLAARRRAGRSRGGPSQGGSARAAVYGAVLRRVAERPNAARRVGGRGHAPGHG